MYIQEWSSFEHVEKQNTERGVKKSPARQLDPAMWRELFTSSSGLDRRQEISQRWCIFQLFALARISRRINSFSELLFDWFRIHVTEVNRRTHNRLLQVTVHGTTDCGRSSNQKCLVFPVCEGWRSSAHVFTTNTPLQGLFWKRFDCFQCKILLKMKHQQLFFIAACERTCLRTFKSNTTRGFAGLLDSWYPKIGRRCAGRSTSGVLFPRDHAHFLSHKWQRERQEVTETHSGMKTPASSSGKYARLFCCLFFALHKRNTLCDGLSLEWLCHHH